jgi:hypothetical protein
MSINVNQCQSTAAGLRVPVRCPKRGNEAQAE